MQPFWFACAVQDSVHDVPPMADISVYRNVLERKLDRISDGQQTGHN
jgi:hypothetical protein